MNTATEKKSSLYFPALTGVRAIAAYMVFFHHYNIFTADRVGKTVHNFVEEWHVGVTLFFVLSGFLIAYRYMDLSKFRFRNYMVNRIARIYPMYFILTTVTFIYFAWRDNMWTLKHAGIYIMNLTFLRGFFDELKFTLIAQGWSLTVEETFYLLAPLLLLLINRKKIFLAVLPVLFTGMGILLVKVFSKYGLHGFFGSYDFMFSYTFFGRCLEFFIGIATAYLFKRNMGKKPIPNLTYLGIIFSCLSIWAISAVKGDLAYGVFQPEGKFLNNVILPLFGISVFFYGLLTEKTFVSRILASDFMVLLGKSSYIFYLIHVGVLAYLVNIWTHNIVILFILMNIISIILFKYMEEPINNYLRKKLTRKVITSPSVASTVHTTSETSVYTTEG